MFADIFCHVFIVFKIGNKCDYWFIYLYPDNDSAAIFNWQGHVNKCRKNGCKYNIISTINIK